MLRSLRLRAVGPAPTLDLALAPRLNLLTGDNGLGKSFVLDMAWFLITTAWANERAFPSRPNARGATADPEIAAAFAYRGESIDFNPEVQFRYHAPTQTWKSAWHHGRKTPGFAPGVDRADEATLRPQSLVIYVRADGGISVWDAYRAPARIAGFGKAAVQLDAKELWFGKTIGSRRVCKGLIDDWIFWRNEGGVAWEFWLQILAALSPPGEALTPDDPVALRLDEDRMIPTLRLPYGSVPITLASAGMKRVLGVAYALVWAWTRHLQAADNRPPTPDLVLLIDEIEAHLHPTWQRVILPAILQGIHAIAPSVSVQALISTHAPLVLASAEAHFDDATDSLFHFRLDGTVVSSRELPFAKQGEAGHWLVSDVFGLRRSRSVEGERAIEAALAFMAGDAAGAEAQLTELARSRPSDATDHDARPLKTRVHAALVAHVPSHDPFWPRWIVSYERGSLQSHGSTS